MPPVKDFADRVFPLRSFAKHLWEGYVVDYARTFDGTIDKLIDEGVLTIPGHYCIIRLDRTASTTKMPDLTHVCTVHDDMSVTHNVIVDLKSTTGPLTGQNLTTWPPR